MVTLPYGRVSYRLDLGGRRATLVEPPPPPNPSPAPLDMLLDDALEHPIGPSLEALAGSDARITVIVSDATRDEPRAALLEALFRRIPSQRVTLAIATGTHGPSGIDSLGLPREMLAAVRSVVDHDGHSDRDLVDVGTTSRGTPVRVHRCVVETDLVVATGCIRPHYFAGFGAGAKAIFPGLGGAREIRINHAMKADPKARAGRLDDNPCRLDIEEAVGLLCVPRFLLDGVCATDGKIHAAVAGDLHRAFRAGARLARPWFSVGARPAPVVIASDALPVTATLYQAAKIAAAAAPLVRAEGDLILVAECADGVGPLDVVNEAIFRIGVLPRLAPGVRVHLVSSLPVHVVQSTLLEPVTDLETVLGDSDLLVVPRASQLILEATV